MILVLALAYPAAIAILFYFAFLRPVQQESKRAREELANITIGDRVLTQAGFIATVKDIVVSESGGPTEIVLELAEGVQVRAVASAISRRLQSQAQELSHEQPRKVTDASQS